MEGLVFLTEINEYGMPSCAKTTHYSSVHTKQAPTGARSMHQNAHKEGPEKDLAILLYEQLSQLAHKAVYIVRCCLYVAGHGLIDALRFVQAHHNVYCRPNPACKNLRILFESFVLCQQLAVGR